MGHASLPYVDKKISSVTYVLFFYLFKSRSPQERQKTTETQGVNGWEKLEIRTLLTSDNRGKVIRRTTDSY